jgi:choline kinase
MIGIVLVAGAGRRLHPLTDDLPKTLLEVADDRTILDIALHNLAAAGITDVVLVTGFASHQVDARLDSLQSRHGVRLRTVFNDKALEWNNAYSLWLAREFFAEDVMLCNGDTVHPASVQRTLLAAPATGVLLAVDDVKSLAEEEMKVILDDAGCGGVSRINKAIDPATAAGEYIGVTRISASVGERLGDALEATWRRDPGLYYEDGYQTYIDSGGTVEVAPIGDVPWVEVDNHADLARAREIAWRY